MWQSEICNGGKCSNVPGSYTCECTAGPNAFSGWNNMFRCGHYCSYHYCKNERFPGGLFSDVDECRAAAGVCGQGSCDNTVCRNVAIIWIPMSWIPYYWVKWFPIGRSFMCRCDDGFSVRPELGTSCIDEDECLLGTYICSHNAECLNTEVTNLNVFFAILEFE